ncbi:MAG: class I SAM-dependent methyltransferase, partial [Anaerolineae bacterium]
GPYCCKIDVGMQYRVAWNIHKGVNIVPAVPPIVLEEDKHWWFATRTRALYSVLDPVLPPLREGRRVLDVGCGAGNMFHHLARYGEVEGIDNNPKPLAVARARGYRVVEGRGESMPFEDNRFDLVAALDVVEHVPDDLAMLRECCRVCKPGGFFVTTVPAFQWLWSHNDEINQHQRRYSKRQLSERLEQAGFVIRRMTFSYFSVFPMAAALIILRRGMNKKPALATPAADQDAYQVEMEPVSPWLNTLLNGVGGVEARFLRWVNLPLGTTIVALAQKPAG